MGMSNFDLKKYLTENKLTKGSQVLKEIDLAIPTEYKLEWEMPKHQYNRLTANNAEELHDYADENGIENYEILVYYPVKGKWETIYKA